MRSIQSAWPLFGILAGNVGAAPTSNPESSTSSISQRQYQQTLRTNNYSGAKLLSVPDGSTFSYVTTQISSPETIFVSAEGSPGQVQTTSAWIGFGGADNGNNGLMQTGCSYYNDGEQDTWSACWYEFFPAQAVFYDGFQPAADDWVTLELYFNSQTSGTSVITNQRTGEQVSASFDAPDGHYVLGNNAEWVVENPNGANNFVNFQKQFFEGCETTTTAGNTYGPGDGPWQIFNEFKDLGDGNGPTKWTNSFLPSDSEVEVDWTGPS